MTDQESAALRNELPEAAEPITEQDVSAFLPGVRCTCLPLWLLSSGCECGHADYLERRKRASAATEGERRKRMATASAAPVLRVDVA